MAFRQLLQQYRTERGLPGWCVHGGTFLIAFIGRYWDRASNELTRCYAGMLYAFIDTNTLFQEPCWLPSLLSRGRQARHRHANQCRAARRRHVQVRVYAIGARRYWFTAMDACIVRGLIRIIVEREAAWHLMNAISRAWHRATGRMTAYRARCWRFSNNTSKKRRSLSLNKACVMQRLRSIASHRAPLRNI